MIPRIIAGILTGIICFVGLVYLAATYRDAERILALAAIAVIALLLAGWVSTHKW